MLVASADSRIPDIPFDSYFNFGKLSPVNPMSENADIPKLSGNTYPMFGNLNLIAVLLV